MRNLLVATRNPHKTLEFKAMLGQRFVVSDLSKMTHLPEVEETGATFEDNATLKALLASRDFDGVVIADDSGLEVDALHGKPGVHSARFAGPDATDAMNRAMLLSELQSAGAAAGSSARFRCVLIVAGTGDVLAKASGAVEGHIISEERGSGGFGYDPLFVPDGYFETFAELPAEIKNTLSHRARALQALMPMLQRL